MNFHNSTDMVAVSRAALNTMIQNADGIPAIEARIYGIQVWIDAIESIVPLIQFDPTDLHIRDQRVDIDREALQILSDNVYMPSDDDPDAQAELVIAVVHVNKVLV